MKTLDQLLNLEDLRRSAQRRLPPFVFDFLEGGAGDEHSLRRNQAAFSDCQLVPRVLVDVGQVDTSVELLGKRISLPLMLAPTGATRLFHREGEMAVARAARAAGIFYALSTMATSSVEDVARVAGPRIFQLYVLRDRGLTKALIERAVASGYDALCLTVDMPVGGYRERDVRNRLAMPFRPTLASMVSMASRPRWAANMVFRTKFEMANFSGLGPAATRHGNMHFVNSQFDRTLTWADAAWFASQSGLPLVIKGILRAEDAQRARDVGARAVMISNHGGRQLDMTPAPFDIIAEVRDAVGDKLEIILDGGIRRGGDILKALARGANACSVGRPYLHGLSIAGEAGVGRMLAILRAEIERDMALMGLPRIDEIDASFVRAAACCFGTER